MSTTQTPDRAECVLRALAATEIAESSSSPELRASFFSLAEHWLEQAEAGGEQIIYSTH